MAHYAFLDENNIVTEVIGGKNEHELLDGLTPEVWYSKFRNQKCVRTSYNNRIRKQFAGIGYFYDEINDVFIEPQPYSSWSLDENFDWQPPIPRPDNVPAKWIWNEELGDWVNAETL